MPTPSNVLWHEAKTIHPPHHYQCGHCGRNVSSDKGYARKDGNGKNYDAICICPGCIRPTFLEDGRQMPGVPFGENVLNLPPLVNDLYAETRNCIAVQAFTAATLLARKLLMNVSVDQGADAGKSFQFYVDYLANNGYVPPRARAWVNHIRTKGNEATHEVQPVAEADAKDLITFTAMILRIVYDFPARLPA